MPLHASFTALAGQLNAAVVGQSRLCQQLLAALIADGHVLLEGPPGLAKTRAIKSLAALVDSSFHRLQFTPDLLPADLTGTEIFRPQSGEFHFEPGPLFHDFILADEINRAPAKVQSALLEAMAERQITVGKASYPLPRLFMVMATQNPLEHSGTFALPEAQLDRFLMHLKMDYPDPEAELRILSLARQEALAGLDPNPPAMATASIGREDVFAARRAALELYLAPELAAYIVALVTATRQPAAVVPALAGQCRFGASPRASIALERCARARAWLAGRDYVSPADIQSCAPDVLRHRIVMTYEGEVEGNTPDSVINALIQTIAVP